MRTNRTFEGIMGNNLSKKKLLNNGVPHGWYWSRYYSSYILLISKIVYVDDFLGFFESEGSNLKQQRRRCLVFILIARWQPVES